MPSQATPDPRLPAGRSCSWAEAVRPKSRRLAVDTNRDCRRIQGSTTSHSASLAKRGIKPAVLKSGPLPIPVLITVRLRSAQPPVVNRRAEIMRRKLLLALALAAFHYQSASSTQLRIRAALACRTKLANRSMPPPAI